MTSPHLIFHVQTNLKRKENKLHMPCNNISCLNGINFHHSKTIHCFQKSFMNPNTPCFLIFIVIKNMERSSLLTLMTKPSSNHLTKFKIHLFYGFYKKNKKLQGSLIFQDYLFPTRFILPILI